MSGEGVHHADRGMSNTVRTTQVVAAGSIACFSAARHGVDTARDHCSRAYAACAGRAGSVKQLAAFGLAQATKANGACNHAAHSAQGGNKDMLMLEVSFPLAGPVGQGKVLDVDDIKEAPWVTVTEQQSVAASDSAFTFMMLDADSTSKHDGKQTSTLMYLLQNMSPQDTRGADVVVPYEPVVNPGRSGAHRVAALLFKQPSRARGSAPHSRSCFEAQQFADEHGLGKPVAGMYFYVVYDPRAGEE